MTLVEDLNNAVDRVVAEFKGTGVSAVNDELHAEVVKLNTENTELKTAIQSAVDHLTGVTQSATSNMANEPAPITSVQAPEEHIPS